MSARPVIKLAASALSKRTFHATSRAPAAGVDNARFPQIVEVPARRPIQVPIITAHGNRLVRGVFDETPEEALEEAFASRDPAYKIVLAAAAATHICPPSALGEVEDPNFQGIVAQIAKPKAPEGAREQTVGEAFKQIWNELFEDGKLKK